MQADGVGPDALTAARERVTVSQSASGGRDGVHPPPSEIDGSLDLRISRGRRGTDVDNTLSTGSAPAL